jgi:hypothetical protein
MRCRMWVFLPLPGTPSGPTGSGGTEESEMTVASCSGGGGCFPETLDTGTTDSTGTYQPFKGRKAFRFSLPFGVGLALHFMSPFTTASSLLSVSRDNDLP